MSENPVLAPEVRRTIEGWHRFVATGRADILRPLLADNIIFRSPVVVAPIPGREAAMLILTTVVQIFEDFRYHREFAAGPADVGLEFSAHIGKWQLKGIDLIHFNTAGEMAEFEVMVRPIKALQALGEEIGARIGPQLAKMKAMAGT